MSETGGQKATVSFSGPLSGVGNGMARMFGYHKKEAPAATAAATGPGQSKPDPEKLFKPKGMRLPVLLWIGARLPFAAFVGTMAMFTYMYHIFPLLPWLLVFFSIDFALLVCWPPQHIGTKHRGIWDWGPMYSWILAIICAICCGLSNYAIIESWVNVTFLREYKDVAATTHADAVSDAGILTFTADTKLDTNSSAGFQYWFYHYCAAPVAPTGKEKAAAPLTFWAVGVGCCDSRGGFTCDSASDESAHSAMPVRAHNLGPEVVEHYNTAIKMSAAVNGYEIAPETVFVVWHKDPKKAGQFAWWIATCFFLLSSMAALCCCMGCQSGFMHISVMQHV